MTSIDSLRSSLRGQLLTPDSPEYDGIRAVWNGMIDRRPLVIARCHGAADVINAVTFARTNRLRVSVRGGGHNVAGLALCDGGIMIDLSLMRGIRVDPAGRTARAESGATWGELDRETLAFGLATTGGMVSTTGIAGLTLGGGLGWQMARHGLACDNLLSADVVTADGRLITATPSQHEDLFWALRGGGGNFGVVTSFEYQLHPMAPFTGGMVLYPIEHAREVLQFYRKYSQDSPDDLTAHAALLTTPDGHDVIAIIAAWFGAAADAATHLDPLRKFGSPIADLIGEMSYTQLQQLFDAATAAGLRRYWKSGYFPEVSDDLIDLVLRHTLRKTSPLSVVLILHMHGRAARTAPDATAFGARAPQWDFDILPQWRTPEEDNEHIQWARAFWREAEPFTRGVYSNHLDTDDGAPRVRAAYGDNYDRLVAIKQKYDPDNFFNVNNNIPPAAERVVPRAASSPSPGLGVNPSL
jgi:FAD/FMN-containing dehydrogenase